MSWLLLKLVSWDCFSFFFPQLFFLAAGFRYSVAGAIMSYTMSFMFGGGTMAH